MITVKELAEVINNDCRDFKYFYAVGLIKETLELWQKVDNFMLLNITAREFINHYLKEDVLKNEN